MISFLDYDIEKCYLMYAALLVFVSVLHQQNSLEDFCRKFSTKAESINWWIKLQPYKSATQRKL